MSSLSSLPEDVLKLVMTYVPQSDRLGSCCLVGTKMHAAAVAATEDLLLQSRSEQHTESLLQWLSHYGQHLTKLELIVRSLVQPLEQMSCPNLLELKLSGYKMQVLLGPADGFSGVIQGCTKLTRLELKCGIIDAPDDNVMLDGSLSSLVHLQHLDVAPTPATPESLWPLSGLSRDVLPQLQHLTHLSVEELVIDNLFQIGALTKLQSLDLMVAYDTPIGPSSVPGLVFPASLKTLFLSTPVEAGILSLVPTGLLDLRVVSVVVGPAEGPGSFWSCMARLQHLTKLLLATKSVVWPPAGPAYSALTASSDLVELDMVDTYFPLGMRSYMFPATRKLPHLTSLKLRPLDDDLYDGIILTPPSWVAADISSLVSCCPSLCEVDSVSLQPGLYVSELHKLTALTYLCAIIDSDALAQVVECIKHLAIVTQLRALDVNCYECADVAGVHLLPLTSLTALTHFYCHLDGGDWSLFTTKVNMLLHTCHVSPSVYVHQRNEQHELASVNGGSVIPYTVLYSVARTVAVGT
jgi:hypothetical protein